MLERSLQELAVVQEKVPGNQIVGVGSHCAVEHRGMLLGGGSWCMCEREGLHDMCMYVSKCQQPNNMVD